MNNISPRMIEEITMNSWPALENYMYDGWVLRSAKGYTKRSNSVYPVYPSYIDVNDKIKFCEKYYKVLCQPAIFKICEAAIPSNLDMLLEQRNYNINSLTSVQVCDLGSDEYIKCNGMEVFRDCNTKWIENVCRLSETTGKNIENLEMIVSRIARPKYLFQLMEDDEAIACGLGVKDRDYFGLFEIVVDKNVRGRGIGQKLISHMQSIAAEEGAKTAYLQVFNDNASGKRLYEKTGFKEIYKYWYRVKHEI